MYAVEFMCLSVVKLMVLDRMKEFAAPVTDRQRQRWDLASRCVMAAVVVGNAVGLLGNITAAVFWTQTAGFAYQAAAANASAANNTDAVAQFVRLGTQKVQVADQAQSVQEFSEVAGRVRIVRVTCVTLLPQVVVLLLVIVSFAVVGVMCLRRVDLGTETTPQLLPLAGCTAQQLNHDLHSQQRALLQLILTP